MELWGLEFRIFDTPLQDCLRFRVQGSGFRVQGSGFRVQGSGFKVQGSGFRVQGLGLRTSISVHVRDLVEFHFLKD